MRTINHFFLITWLILFTFCSQKKEALNIAHQFFTAFDKKDFKTAYQLLSTNDKKAISSDSFYIMFYNLDDNFARFGEPSKLSTFLESKRRDTFIVQEVAKIPDYNLISQMKTKETKFSELLKKMETEKSTPMIIDSSRTLTLTKENGRFAVYLGLANYQRYELLLKQKHEQYSAKIRFTPDRIRLTRTNYRSFLAEAVVEVNNQSNYDIKIGGFTCSLFVDGIPYPDEPLFVDAIKAGQKSLSSAFLLKNPEFLEKYLPRGIHEDYIQSERIIIKPLRIEFDDTLQLRIQTEALEESGLKYFKFLAPGFPKALLDF